MSKKVAYEGPIAGVGFHAFRLRPDRLANLDLIIVPEPENQSDPKAIAFFHVDPETQLKRRVGFMPRESTNILHAHLVRGRLLTAKVTHTMEVRVGRFNRSRTDWCVTVWWEIPEQQTFKNPLVKRRLLL